MRYICSTIMVLFSGWVLGQELLTKRDALLITLEENLNIKIAKGNTKTAEHNASFLNSGYLPSLSTSSNATLNQTDSKTSLRDGSEVTLTGVETSRYSASLDLKYTLFDGLVRSYDYKKFKKQYGLSEIETQEVISNTIFGLFDVYYNVAQLTDNVNNLNKMLDISKDRLRRAKLNQQYGQKTKLDLLNAEVDVSNDSINLINMVQELRNAKRDLNLVMNRDLTVEYQVDTLVTFLQKQELMDIYEGALENNFSVRKAQENVLISEYTHKSNKSQFLPKIGLSGSYSWNKNINSPVSFATKNSSNGIAYGADLTWNMFARGKGVVAIKNSRIKYETSKYSETLARRQAKRDIDNAWESYQNALYVLEARKQVVLTNENNFQRTKELYGLGQIPSIDFRQAQVNLYNAMNNRDKAKYDAKRAELQVLVHSGKILEVDFL